MEQPTLKRFEEWEHVDCNDCSHYWDSSCDGASKDSKIGCNSYSATRSVVLPAKIRSLERRIKWLEWSHGIALAILGGLFVLYGLGWI